MWGGGEIRLIIVPGRAVVAFSRESAPRKRRRLCAVAPWRAAFSLSARLRPSPRRGRVAPLSRSTNGAHSPVPLSFDFRPSLLGQRDAPAGPKKPAEKSCTAGLQVAG